MLRGPVLFFNVLKQIFCVALFQFYSEAALEKIITKLTCLEKQDIMPWSPSSYWSLHSQNLFCISLILSKNTSHTSVLWEREKKNIISLHAFMFVSGNFHFRFSFLHEVKGIMCKMRCSCQRGMNESQKKGYCEKMLSHLWKILVTWHLLYVYCTYCVYLLYLLMSFMY